MWFKDEIYNSIINNYWYVFQSINFNSKHTNSSLSKPLFDKCLTTEHNTCIFFFYLKFIFYAGNEYQHKQLQTDTTNGEWKRHHHSARRPRWSSKIHGELKYMHIWHLQVSLLSTCKSPQQWHFLYNLKQKDVKIFTLCMQSFLSIVYLYMFPLPINFRRKNKTIVVFL